MPKIIAYIRASTNKQELDAQRLTLLEFARHKGMHIDEFIEITISSRRCTKQRRIEEVINMLQDDHDTLIVTELSRLGRSTTEVISLVNALVDRNIRVIIAKQGLDISKHDMHSKVALMIFSLFSELERDLISMRTKEALQAKKQKGQILGRPKGVLCKSKYDKDIDKIKELLTYGLSIQKIIKVLGYGRVMSLYTYVKKRNIKNLIQNPI